MITFELRVPRRASSHWSGGYTKQQFEARITPLLNAANARLDRKAYVLNIYHVSFNSAADAVTFRKQFTDAMLALHPKLGRNFTWEEL